MTNEEIQRLLPLAAKACGFDVRGFIGSRFLVDFPGDLRGEWNPLSSVEACAEMNATLEHSTHWQLKVVWVGYGNKSSSAEHNGTTADKLRAWMEASVRAAARVGEKEAVKK